MTTMKSYLRMPATIVLVAVLLLLAMLWAMQQATVAQAAGEPEPGTVQQIETRTFYGPTALTTGTVYSTYTTTLGSGIVGAVGSYNSADVFLVVDVTGVATATITAQFSADGTNWANADYEYWNGSAIGTQSYARTMTADGTEYMRVPIAGEYMRFQIAATGTLTPTILATLRNN